MTAAFLHRNGCFMQDRGTAFHIPPDRDNQKSEITQPPPLWNQVTDLADQQVYPPLPQMAVQMSKVT